MSVWGWGVRTHPRHSKIPLVVRERLICQTPHPLLQKLQESSPCWDLRSCPPAQTQSEGPGRVCVGQSGGNGAGWECRVWVVFMQKLRIESLGLAGAVLAVSGQGAKFTGQWCWVVFVWRDRRPPGVGGRGEWAVYMLEGRSEISRDRSWAMSRLWGEEADCVWAERGC